MAYRFSYHIPVVGEVIETEHGKAIVLRLILYREAIDEMRASGTLEKDIKRFKTRISRFFQDVTKYFECEVVYPDGESERIDWSEYCRFLNTKRRRGVRR
jgi:hypothetical protein